MQKKHHEFCHPGLSSYILPCYVSYIASKNGFVIQHEEMAKPLGDGENLPEGPALRSSPVSHGPPQLPATFKKQMLISSRT